MNKTEAYLERKEYWRNLIKQYDASGQSLLGWCRENNVSGASLRKWRTVIWQEEEAEKEFVMATEEQVFVEIAAELSQKEKKEEKDLILSKKDSETTTMGEVKSVQTFEEAPRMVTPDAVIGYRGYMVGVYEHTSSQMLQKVMEVLKYA